MIFDFSNYGELLQLVQASVFAGAVLGIVGGLIGVFVMQRDMAFAGARHQRAVVRGGRGSLAPGDERGSRVPWSGRSSPRRSSDSSGRALAIATRSSGC